MMKKILVISAVLALTGQCYAAEHTHIESHQNDQGKGWDFAGKVWDTMCEVGRQVSQATEHVAEAAVDTFGQNRPDSMRGTGFFSDWKENVKK